MYEGVGFALLILYYYHDYIHTETKLFNNISVKECTYACEEESPI